MKFGVRTPSLKRSLKARTTGRIKRSVKRAVAPGYGEKGMGWVTNPKKAAYNKIYNKTTVGGSNLVSSSQPFKSSNKDYNSYESFYFQQTPVFYNKTIFLCTIFGGWFGLHRYMRKQIGMGILYTFTLGLFCIGWIVDIVVEATRAKSENSTSSSYIPEQLERELQIMNESAQIMQTTTNPETFFTRYDLYIEKLRVLSNAETDGINFEGDSPTEKLAEVSMDHEKTELINKMIDRYWDKTIAKTQTLKTEKGKQNQIIKFKDELSKYESRMPQASIFYYQSKQ